MKQFDLFENNNEEDIFLQEAEEYILYMENEIEKLEEKERFYKENHAFNWAENFPQICDENGNFEGFDIVMGNPPYISISKYPNLKNIKDRYEVYQQSGDIYALFIERCFYVLKSGGFLSFITSNKWLRSAYGESLRKFLIEKTLVQKIVDFNSLKVFNEATVDTNVLYIQKSKTKKALKNQVVKAVRLNKNFNLEKDSIFKYFDKYQLKLNNLTSEIWNLTSKKENLIQQKIEAKGKFLKDWDIKIYRGITTGLNKAFIIDTKMKNLLIKKDEKNKEIIKPLLRGRDIKKYTTVWDNLWLINTHNGIKSKKIKAIDVKKDYPFLFKYLKKFTSKLKNRQDKGYHWSNLRNCTYFSEFEKEKIIFTKASQVKSFVYDKKGHFLLNTSYLMTGKNLKYLLALLNSKLISFAFMHFYQSGGINGEITVQGIREIPIPEITTKNQILIQNIETLVNEILKLKEKDTKFDTSKLEKEIDILVYKLYNLTKEEIKIIENETI